MKSVPIQIQVCEMLFCQLREGTEGIFHLRVWLNCIIFFPSDPPHSHLSQQQCQSLSKSAVISSKQAHSELTQRLEQFLDRSRQSPLQEAPFSRRQNSDMIAKAKDAPIPFTSKEKQTKENVPVRRRSIGRTPKEADDCLVSAPKAPASKALQQHKAPEVKARANQDLSSKETVNNTANILKILHFVMHFSNILHNFLRRMQNLLATW